MSLYLVRGYAHFLSFFFIRIGLPTFHYLVTDRDKTNYDRIHELIERAYEVDNSVLLQEIDTTIDRPLHEVFEPFDWILYVSQNGDIDGLKQFTLFVEKRKEFYTSYLFINTRYSWTCRNGKS